ncbi:MAG: glycosyltransferase [Bryobacteraceae bacterium]|nr:glycosyltransferase [Bryobacteraceae bacterium]
MSCSSPLEPIPETALPACDVIIPVYNQPHWVARCVRELFRNTPRDALGEVFLVDDGSGESTKQRLGQLAEQFNQVRLLRHEQRMGFAEAVNTALARSSAPYVLLLNSDCLLTPRAIPKLVDHCRREASIGLVSPLSNNSPPLTVPMPEGFNFHRMNALLESRLAGRWMDACTIVGNALLLTRECLQAVGPFRQWHGFGYGEETDYQFRAAERGFRSVAALDTYVYHAGNQSFAADPAAASTRLLNQREFFERWGKAYKELASRVPPEAPAEEARRALQSEQGPLRGSMMFVLPTLDDRIGGTHTVADLCNAAALEGLDFQLATLRSADRIFWNLPLYFSPIAFPSIEKFLRDSRFHPSVLVATSWDTVAPVMLRSASEKRPWIYFVQGYESYFEDGRAFVPFLETLKAAEEVLTTSAWLREMASRHCRPPIRILPIGFDDAVFFPRSGTAEQKKIRVCAMARGSLAKGQPFLLEILDRLSPHRERVEAVLFHPPELQIPSSWEGFCEKRPLPVLRPELAEILRNSDVFLDTSLYEGFGLAPLEAMASGCAVVASSSGGVSEYIEDGVNAILIREVNQPQAYVEQVLKLEQDRARLGRIRKAALETAARFRGSERYADAVRMLAERGAEAAESRPSSQRAGASGLKRLVRAFDMLRTDFVGMDAGQSAVGLEARVSRLEATVDEILTSRIWRTLRAVGGVLLTLAGVAGKIRSRLGLMGSR